MNIAIVGAGKLGRKVATALLGGNYEITIIDKNEEKLHFRPNAKGKILNLKKDNMEHHLNLSFKNDLQI